MSKAVISSFIVGGALLLAAGAAFSQPAPAAPAAAPAAGDAAHGDTLFKQRCSGCHTAGDYVGDSSGPDLDGVVGRTAGTQKGFDYSDGLAKSALVLTPATLDQFLSGPAALVPGSTMGVKVAQPEVRADIIAYLATLKAPK